MEERHQKILARSGFGSPRSCEQIISAGRVKVNGIIAILGSKADHASDKITVDDQPIPNEPRPAYIALNKPIGVLSAVYSPEGRRTVRDLVELQGHLYPVGRLDIDSEGLIILTNDGELANQLTHPKFGHEKEYRVLVNAKPDTKQLDIWRRGVVMTDGYRTQPAKVQVESEAGKGTWLRITLTEGRKRQIREIGSLIGLPVYKIIRTRIGNVHLGALKPGQWRHLTDSEVNNLHESLIRKPNVSRRKQTQDN